jgi:propanol-preferring alcohol dehydrogenase
MALGPDAKGVEVGKAHTVYLRIGCRPCSLCQSGQEHLCTRPRAVGTSVDGGYADHLLVPDTKYLIEIGDLDGGLAACYMCSVLWYYSI